MTQRLDLAKKTPISWATAARNGQKKARVELDKDTYHAQPRKTEQAAQPQQAPPPGKQIKHQPKGIKQSGSAGADKRIFLRLPQEHEWRKLSPSGIREVAVRHLEVSPSAFGRIKSVRTSFALSPCNDATREETLKAANGFSLSGAKIEPAANWVPMIIPTVPSFI